MPEHDDNALEKAKNEFLFNLLSLWNVRAQSALQQIALRHVQRLNEVTHALSTHAIVRSLLAALVLLLGLKLLLLEVCWLGVLEENLVGRQLRVGVRESLELVVDQLLVQGVEEDLLLATSILADFDGPAKDASGADNILKNSSVHSLESSRARAHLGWVVNGCIKG